MVALLVALTCLTVATVAPAAEELQALRAARRASVRDAALDKADGAGVFGLLVIPVEFADASFPTSPPDLSQLVALDHYLAAASQERTVLAMQIAAVVTLPGDRADYSDLGWQGHSRSREMVRLALEAAAAAGSVFAVSDHDGDGEVDGVLVLHAGPGQENDPDGLIVPMQFFLADPVLNRGTVARSYAIVSASSTVGILAHETFHLLGLEDRYDLNLVGSAETGPLGGLGRFSLMAAGWLGTGDGTDPALPDAYSRRQLGWIDLSPTPDPSAVVRLRQDGPAGPEYFLAEVRSPTAHPPYDAALPAARLLVYQVDERLADGQMSSPNWPHRHLRVEIKEADGGREIARGESLGEVSDFFPAEGLSQVFADTTFPWSLTWSGDDTGVDIAVTVNGGELQFQDRGRGLWGDLRLRVTVEGDAVVVTPVLRFDTDLDLPASVVCELEALDPAWGSFEGGTTVTDDLAFITAPNTWEQYGGSGFHWLAADDVPADARTTFRFSLAGGAQGSGELTHVWDASWSDLTLEGAWPGSWTVTAPGADVGTTWHRWLPLGTPSLPETPILAATGMEFATAGSWPDIIYGNNAHTRLVSPPLGADLRWLEITQTVDLELLYQAHAVDGVTLTWIHDAGYSVPAEPADGWQGTVDRRAQHALAGAPTFAVSETLGDDSRPLWRREVLPVPDPSLHGPGPWRLRFDLASNAILRRRGWLVRNLMAHLDEAPASGFPVRLEPEVLAWTWPTGDNPAVFGIERSADGGATWQVAHEAGFAAGEGPHFEVARSLLGVSPGGRSYLRVIAAGTHRVVSPAVKVIAAGEVVLGSPRPNPFAGECRLDVDGGGDLQTEVALYDLRGRLVRRWQPGGQPTVISWDGDTDGGQRVAAGVYIFRMRARGRTLTRKVTWLP